MAYTPAGPRLTSSAIIAFSAPRRDINTTQRLYTSNERAKGTNTRCYFTDYNGSLVYHTGKQLPFLSENNTTTHSFYTARQ